MRERVCEFCNVAVNDRLGVAEVLRIGIAKDIRIDVADVFRLDVVCKLIRNGDNIIGFS